MKPIPNISLPTNRVSLMDIKSVSPDWLVLFFYPKDDTPHCTIEAIEFEKSRKTFAQFSTQIMGISSDGVESHQAFADKYSLSMHLLSDKDKLAKKAFNVENRSTFLIDADNNIVHEWRNVDINGHVNEVLNKVRELKI